MKATLEFTLPEELAEFRLAQQGGAYRCVVEDLSNRLRNHLKYDDDLEPNVRQALEKIRAYLAEICLERGVNPWEEP